jgi:hypothetical protein
MAQIKDYELHNMVDDPLLGPWFVLGARNSDNGL